MEASLLDPAICGEDLEHAARRVLQLAPRHCGDCADYHLLRTLKRFASGSKGSTDRREMAAIIARLTDDALSAGGDTVEILLAGTGDTGLLGTCVHGALGAPTASPDRLHVTVMDRCETPLALCRDFGARNGIAVTTVAGDLLGADAPPAADIIAVHSLFSFIPAERHAAALSRFASWLKPGGRIVFSTDIAGKRTSERAARRERQIERIRARLAQEAIADAGTLAELDARLGRFDTARNRHVHDFGSEAEVEALFARAGLRRTERRAVPSGKPGEHDRLVYALAP